MEDKNFIKIFVEIRLGGFEEMEEHPKTLLFAITPFGR